MSLAKACCIEVPDFDVVHRENVEIASSDWVTTEEYAFSIARFDRSDQGRVHMEDFCQAGNLPGFQRSKYQSSVEYVMRSRTGITICRRLLSVSVGRYSTCCVVTMMRI